MLLKNQIKYRFITFEGIDGSGKSTQAKMLYDYLCQCNIETCLTREPGGTKGAEEIRKILLSGSTAKWDGISETLLNFAARRDHILNFIQPQLNKGNIVICDRFTDSTTAYQAYGYEIDKKIVDQIKQIAIGKFEPDITFLIDLPCSKADERILKRGANNRYEAMTKKFNQNVHKGFKEVAQQNPSRIKTIDGLQSIGAIFKEIKNYLTI